VLRAARPRRGAIMRVLALLFAIVSAAAPLESQSADSARAAIRQSVQRQVDAARAEAESARAAAMAAVDSARNAGGNPTAPPVERPALTGQAASGYMGSELVSDVAFFVVVCVFFVLLWVVLGRADVRRWLGQRHGVQVLMLWGLLCIYTPIACLSTVVGLFEPSAPSGLANIPVVHLGVLWFALLIITWRWASARGAVTRAR